MDIKFIKLLPRDGLRRMALFIVDNKEIKIGITNTLIGVWNIQNTDKMIGMFLNQFGKLMIQLMIAKNELTDYTFMSNNFTDDNGKIVPKNELLNHLEDKILDVIDKDKEIGFKG